MFLGVFQNKNLFIVCHSYLEAGEWPSSRCEFSFPSQKNILSSPSLLELNGRRLLLAIVSFTYPWPFYMHDFYIALQTDNMAVTHDNITRMSASPSFYFHI